MKTILLVLLLLFPNKEKRIEIQILDNESKQPIPFVVVLSLSFNGIANEEGRIVIPQNIEDTLVFQCLGYEVKQVVLSGIKQYNGFPTVFLEPKSYAIKEATISASRIKKSSVDTINEVRVRAILAVLEGRQLYFSLQKKK